MTRRMRGGEMFDLLVDEGAYSEDEAMYAVLATVKAVKYLHAYVTAQDSALSTREPTACTHATPHPHHTTPCTVRHLTRFLVV